MRRIGIVASKSSVTGATVILNEGEEKKVKTEDLVLIDNKNGNKILAVCRRGFGVDENLEVGGYYRPGIIYARKGYKPSDAKQHFNFSTSAIADVTATFGQNKIIIAPSSDVHIFEEGDNPMKYLRRGIEREGGEIPTVGFYKDKESWDVPVNPEYISRHIGVFGVTGCGKSFLTRYQLIPMLRKSGYDILIIDWKGYDYATNPMFEGKAVKLGEILLDEDTIIELLASKMEYFRVAGYQKKESKPYYALSDVIHEKPWREHLGNLDEFKRLLRESVEGIFDEMGETGEIYKSYVPRYKKQFERALEKLSAEDFEKIKGRLTPEELLKRIKDDHEIVLDVSGASADTKLSVFLTIARYLKGLIEKEKEELNLALVIDEGPQYCPYKPGDIQKETTDMITDLCALGRAYKLSIVIISQGMAGEIGINSAVRRNLNTQFIGKIHPLDRGEAEDLLGAQGVDIDFLTKLPVGHFYFLGSMNPSPIPLLISFKIPVTR